MKVYKYKYSYFLVSQLIPSVLMCGVFVWSIQQMQSNPDDIWYKWLVVAISLLIVSTFVCLNTPNKVIIKDGNIYFFSFGMKHAYDMNKVKTLSVKEFWFSDKYLVQIGEPNLLRGRYWISKTISDNDELLAYLKEKEKSLQEKKGKNLKKEKKK